MLKSLFFVNCVFCRLGLDTQSTISFDAFINHFQNNEVGVNVLKTTSWFEVISSLIILCH